VNGANSGTASQGNRWTRLALIAAGGLALAALPSAVALGQPVDPSGAAQIHLDPGEERRFQPLSWRLLTSFAYDIPGLFEEASKEEIARRSEAIVPQQIRALDGKDVALRGYVIPLDTQGTRITSFVLAATNQITCCFGDSLAMNEWVIVDVPEGQEFESEPFEMATVLGRFDVGEDVQDGFVMSLYRMVPEKIRKG
jgi:hypothetical protein